MSRLPLNIDSTEIVPFLRELSGEVLNAAIHYKQYKDLSEAIPAYQDEMNITPTFWNLTINANLTTARSSLFRAYDFAPEGVNLHRLMANIEDHVTPAASGVIDQNQIDVDRQLVSRSDPLVANHVMLRNNVFAHKNFEHAIGKKVTPKQTYDELQTLIDRAAEILNRYSGEIRRGTWSTLVAGHDDYKHVLDAIKREWVAYLKQCDAEAAEVEAEAAAKGDAVNAKK